MPMLPNLSPLRFPVRSLLVLLLVCTLTLACSPAPDTPSNEANAGGDLPTNVTADPVEDPAIDDDSDPAPSDPSVDDQDMEDQDMEDPIANDPEVTDPGDDTSAEDQSDDLQAMLPEEVEQPLIEGLATELAIAPDQITVSAVESVDWGDACLGLGRPDEGCAQMITPGYRVTLSTPEGEYTLHSDRTGQNYRIAPQD